MYLNSLVWSHFSPFSPFSSSLRQFFKWMWILLFCWLFTELNFILLVHHAASLRSDRLSESFCGCRTIESEQEASLCHMWCLWLTYETCLWNRISGWNPKTEGYHQFKNNACKKRPKRKWWNASGRKLRHVSVWCQSKISFNVCWNNICLVFSGLFSQIKNQTHPSNCSEIRIFVTKWYFPVVQSSSWGST